MTNRRNFIRQSGALGLGIWVPLSEGRAQRERQQGRELSADVVIVGGSLGGCAAALVALRHGLRVILTEETDWVGGQLTSQAVPPDEHRWIEEHGATKRYRQLRRKIREYYRRHYPLNKAALEDPFLNPGGGSVSRLCHEPRVAEAVLRDALAPYLSAGRLQLLLEHEPIAADVEGDSVRAVQMRRLTDGWESVLRAPVFIDATELGDLLPLSKTEYVTGAEARSETGEMHAADEADPKNQQALTVCFAMDYRPGEDHSGDAPKDYAFWRDFVPQLRPAWPGKLLSWVYTHPRSLEPRKLGFNPTGDRHDGVVNLWTYRRILGQSQFEPGAFASDISLVNWPQNDYFLNPIVDVTPEARRRAVAEAKQLSLSLLYWMQTEAPRLDGGQGYPGLRLRPDVTGTSDGLAKYPYVRESRRILAESTVVEGHCGRDQRAEMLGMPRDQVIAETYDDSVGIGYYPIDLHPSTAGDNYIDFDALPFQIPLGALLPRRMENLLPACKNIGSTHVTNGCYRLHPVEWGIGEAVGSLVVFAKQHGVPLRAVRAREALLKDYQRFLQAEGVELAWPSNA